MDSDIPSYDEIVKYNTKPNSSGYKIATLILSLALLVVVVLTIVYLVWWFGIKDALKQAKNNTQHCDIPNQSPACSGDVCKKDPIKCMPPYFNDNRTMDITTFDSLNNVYETDWTPTIKGVLGYVANIGTGLQFDPIKFDDINYTFTDLINETDTRVFGRIYIHKPEQEQMIIWIPLRGTDIDIPEEIVDDFKFNQEKVVFEAKQVNTQTETILVHEGFLEIFNKIKPQVIDKLTSIGFDPLDKKTPIIVSGHSLGAGVAILLATALKALGYNVLVITIAGPRVGNVELVKYINRIVSNDSNQSPGLKVYRLVNSVDLIPDMPWGVTPNTKKHSNPNMYVHAGFLLVFTDNWNSLIWNHLLNVYIRAIDNDYVTRFQSPGQNYIPQR